MTRKRGLTLGKFAPLHKGHQLVIEAALAEMDETLLIIYDCPEITTIPLGVRANWIRTLYPAVKVIEAWDGPTEVGDTPEIRQRHERYVLDSLRITGVTHFYCSEFYGAHISQALGAINRSVDERRTTIPVSGTAIRQNPFAYRDFLHPLVYRDLIANIVFLGAPSTGKTTLAERLAEEFQTVWTPEYGREYWLAHQVSRRLSLEQLVEIAAGHLERENALLLQANQFLFTDTNVLTTYTFSRYYHGMVHPRLVELTRMACSRYDIIVVCDIDIPYADTWDRSGEINRTAFQQQVLSDLRTWRVPYFLLPGTLEDRIARMKALLRGYQKYTNVLELCAEPRPQAVPSDRNTAS